MPEEKVADRYWLKMGALAVESLSDVLRDDLTPRRREIVAEYLGSIMDNAYDMGIRLGKFSSDLQREDHQ